MRIFGLGKTIICSTTTPWFMLQVFLNFSRSCQYKLTDWPAVLPDLCIIESVWDVLARLVYVESQNLVVRATFKTLSKAFSFQSVYIIYKHYVTLYFVGFCVE